MRTFIAINFDETVKRELADYQDRLRPDCGRVKWVNPKIMHLTLKFLGEISDRQIVPISSALDELAAQCRPIEITVEGSGTFPPSGSIKVVWVGICDAAGKLAECHKRCDDLLDPLGFPRERRGFSPHLTLARNKDPRNSRGIMSALKRARPMVACEQAVTGVTFYQSTLTREGPIYQVLSRHDFPT